MKSVITGHGALIRILNWSKLKEDGHIWIRAYKGLSSLKLDDRWKTSKKVDGPWIKMWACWIAKTGSSSAKTWKKAVLSDWEWSVLKRSYEVDGSHQWQMITIGDFKWTLVQSLWTWLKTFESKVNSLSLKIGLQIR